MRKALRHSRGAFEGIKKIREMTRQHITTIFFRNRTHAHKLEENSSTQLRDILINITFNIRIVPCLFEMLSFPFSC